MVDFLIMSLLVMLCLEQNPVNLHEPATGQKVVTGDAHVSANKAGCFGQSVKR